MPTTAWITATSALQIAGPDKNWENLAEATQVNNSGCYPASPYTMFTGEKTDFLVLSGLDFSSVPAGSTISGIEVLVRISRAGAAWHTQAVITETQLRVGGVAVGSAKGNQSINGTGWASFTFGGAADLWGRAGGFGRSDLDSIGMQFRVANYDPKINLSSLPTVDYGQVRVTYTVPPTVTSCSPSSGTTAGGTEVTITGTDFTGATGVTFGGAAATSVVVVNATTITCATPVGTAGAKDVTVTTAAGTGTLVGGFTYALPAPVVSANSASGIQGVGGTVQMSATNSPTSWSLPESPPTGVSINSSGLVTWTSETPANVHSITVRATNAGGSGNGTLTLTLIGNTTTTTTSTTTTSCRDNYPRFGLYTWIPGCAPINWRNSRFKREP